MFTLYAEREGHRIKHNADLASLDEASVLLETYESYGQWPEGYDAVCYRGADILSAEAWIYTDGWEKME